MGDDAQPSRLWDKPQAADLPQNIDAARAQAIMRFALTELDRLGDEIRAEIADGFGAIEDRLQRIERRLGALATKKRKRKPKPKAKPRRKRR